MVVLLGLFQKWVGIVREPYVIYLAVQNPYVPGGRKIAAIISIVLLTAYIVNPFDFIPEFVPFGFIDDLIVIPLATYFIERLFPREVVHESRVKAQVKLKPFTRIINIISIILLVLVILAITVIVVSVILIVQQLR